MIMMFEMWPVLISYVVWNLTIFVIKVDTMQYFYPVCRLLRDLFVYLCFFSAYCHSKVWGSVRLLLFIYFRHVILVFRKDL